MIGRSVCDALIVIAATNFASASEHRSHAVTREFQRGHPCPSTGRASGPCPGYRKDHIVPVDPMRFQSPMVGDGRRQGYGRMEA
jgi:hypothetical protein